MTKHLRFLMLFVVTIMCSRGGYCQVWEKVSISDLTSSDIFVIVGTYSSTAYALPNDHNSYPIAKPITLTANGKYISSEVTKNLEWKIKKQSTNSYRFNSNSNNYDWLFFNDKLKKARLEVAYNNTIFSIYTKNNTDYLKTTVKNSNYNYYINIDGTKWCANTSMITGISFYKYIPDALQPTTTSFGYYSKKKYTFNAGVPEKVVKPRATAKNDISQKDLSEHIIYSSSNSEIVTVDAKTGELTFTNTKFGTADIRARLIKTDSYKESSDYYTVENIDNRIEDTDFIFGREGYTVALESAADGIATFNTKTALRNPNNLNVSYSISPASDDATIDETNGVVRVKKRGTYTITATGAANETYREATATCTLQVTHGISVTERTVSFTPGYNKGHESSRIGVEMSSGNVTVHSLNAELSKSDKYSFYNTKHTISCSIGKIVKIEFYGKDNTHPLTWFNYEGTEGTLTKTALQACWDGYATKVVFTSSSEIYVTKIDVTLEIPPLKTYTIDETKTDNLIENYRNANVTIKRSLSASHWNTLCLPFNLSSEEVKKYFGEGTELREYRNEFSNYIATFVPAYSMKAGIPYIMKPGNDIVENPTFTGVSMVASPLDSNNNPLPVGDSKVFQMKGIYNQTMLKTDKTELFLGDGNLFYYPVEGDIDACTMDGMRAYFIVPKNTDTNKLRANIDGSLTPLTHIFATEGSDAPVYNTMGQYAGNSLNSLKRGIYIQNGKKVVVK